MSLDTAAVNLRWALTLIDGLVAAGVGHAVISPGSRSTPLALACDGHPALRTWVVLDERSAAFFALGLAMAEKRPVAVAGTSGSAPANWFPAVIEANHGAHPLILLSADRPPELRECGANQTVDQVRLFGGHVRLFFDLGIAEDSPAALRHVALRAAQAADRSRWPLAGPVHLNVPLREPLVPRAMIDFPFSAPATVVYPVMAPRPEEIVRLAAEFSGRPGLIVCGSADYPDGFPAAVAQLAHTLECPVLADPLSGLRFGGHSRGCVLSRYDAFLRNENFAAGHRPAWVLRFGALPVSRALQQYLAAQGEARHILVDAHGRWPDPLHLTTDLLRADAAAACGALAEEKPLPAPAAWLADFLEQERFAAERLAEMEPPVESGVVRALVEHLPAGAVLFSGNSMPIRDLDGFSGSGEKSLRIVANRGASGIDGNVSTLLGMAAAGKTVVGLLGDLALSHDLGGLALARGLDVTLVVLNNGGGGIFGYLPQAGLKNFERLWLTPAGLDFEQAASLYGLNFRRVDTVCAFENAFTQALAHAGPDLIEVSVPREASVDLHRAYWAAVSGS